MLSSFCLFWLEIVKPLSIRNISPKYEIWLKFYLDYRHNMTNWLKFFLAFYILVGQPALLGRMLDNCSLYQLAWLNAWVFVIAWIISALCKPNKPKAVDNTAKITERSEEKVSRIENDNGIAVVSVEKKQEVVLETMGNENQEEVTEWLTENNEEKLEEKPEEKIPERPMRESVTIPKIVQPLSWHQTPKKKKREIRWGQRLVLLLTLCVAAVISRTLWEFLGTRWVAISLFLWWILYLVIGKLFDIDGFYNAKKLFTNWLYIILILAWIGYGIYATQDSASFNLLKDKATSYVQNRVDSQKEEDSEENTWDIIYVFEWTGEVIDSEEMAKILDETWTAENEVVDEIEDTEVDTWIVENSEPEIEAQPEPVVEGQTSNLSPEEAKKQVTMWEAIKSLLAWAKLSTKTNISFKYVSKSNELYPYFKTAQEKWMIWTDTDPSKLVSCDTYITMKWIWEWRNVGSYSKDQVKAVYWNKAAELWKLNGCEKGKYVTKWNL